jgi:DNA mismatch endonuclease, patch repair protein
MGYRFRLHKKGLPGTPDLVLASHRAVIFVHGCFWHRHPRCRKASNPTTRVEFWRDKFERNVARDNTAKRNLREAGWRVLVVWECHTRRLDQLQLKLVRFLDTSAPGTQLSGHRRSRR